MKALLMKLQQELNVANTCMLLLLFCLFRWVESRVHNAIATGKGEKQAQNTPPILRTWMKEHSLCWTAAGVSGRNSSQHSSAHNRYQMRVWTASCVLTHWILTTTDVKGLLLCPHFQMRKPRQRKIISKALRKVGFESEPTTFYTSRQTARVSMLCCFPAVRILVQSDLRKGPCHWSTSHPNWDASFRRSRCHWRGGSRVLTRE